MHLDGKLAVLTGASRGIGRALATKLAGTGCNLVLTALEPGELTQLEDELRATTHAAIRSLPLDLTDASAREELVRFVRELATPPDILINNSGIGFFGRFDSVTWKSIERTLELNVHAVTHLTHELLPILRVRPQAKIVNVSSASARFPYPCMAVYGASKAFVSAFSETLACELAGSAVSVLCVHPGFTDTPFIKSAGMDLGKVPPAMIHRPDRVAARIVRAIERDQRWVYGDVMSRVLTDVADVLPVPVRSPLFRNLFWRLPDAT